MLAALRSILSDDKGEVLSDQFVAIVKGEFNTRRRYDGDTVQTSNNDEGTRDNGNNEGISNIFIENLKNQLQNHLDKHHAGVRSNTRKGCSVALCSNDKSRIEVILFGEKVFDSHNFNTSNHTCGTWSGTFFLEGTRLRGQIRMNTHYFENCNFQLKSEQDFGPQTLSPETIAQQRQDQTLSEAAVKQIYAWEQEFIRSLDETIRGIGEDILKSLRRVMPITRQKMDWNVQPHRLIKILGTTAKDTSIMH